YVLAAANGKDGWRIIAKNTEYKVFLLIFVIATALITIDLSSEMGWSVTESLRFAAFQAASLSSTTGFVSADFDLWPSFSKGVLLMLMFLGGCAGSTAGGFKITRFIVLLKMVKNLISQKLHPQSITRITVNGVQFPEQVLFNIARHFFVYVMLDVLFAFFLIFDGISMIDAVSISISTMSSVGPGFGIAGATSTYALLPTFSEAVACFAMFLGRLEIFTVLALLTPEFWRKGKRW
ncbi:MAG: TrkH family potassium uptake protein, partial [Schwartzia sp.]|nr:TrkH family potassium uptake protein [Schwartzia sp. (in: firmicutes)]